MISVETCIYQGTHPNLIAARFGLLCVLFFFTDTVQELSDKHDRQLQYMVISYVLTFYLILRDTFSTTGHRAMNFGECIVET